MVVKHSDSEIISLIKEYPHHEWMCLQIWESSECKIELVLIICESEIIKLDNHLVLHLAELNTEQENVSDIRKYGNRIKRVLKKNFADKEIHSEMYYR